MNLILRALFNLLRHRAAHRSVGVVIDAASGADGAEVARYLRPWSSWVTVVGTTTIEGSVPRDLVQTLALSGCEIVMVVSDQESLLAEVGGACAHLRLTSVGTEFPPQESRELGLLQEVMHHDSELGGFNEWSRSDPQASSWILRMLSITHCHRQFPAYVAPYLQALRRENGGRPLEAIDVGCGPVSRLRWGALNGLLRVTGVDPLLDMYAVVLERHGLTALPSIRCAREVSAGAEEIPRLLPAGGYDFAYSSNALDHTEDPAAIVRSLGGCVRPGGFVALEVFTREGSREKWWQLHQFDMYVDDMGQFVCEDRNKQVTPLFPPGCDFEVLETPIKHDMVTAVVARRC